MKKIYLMIFGAMALSAQAQQMLDIYGADGSLLESVETNGEEMIFSDGTITIQGVIYNLADISKMAVTQSGPDDNTVMIEYNGNAAEVRVASNIKDYITYNIDGAHVTINQSSDVNEDTCGEITYILQGESDNGSLLFNGSYKATLELYGLTLTNPNGAAIDIQNGKRIDFSSKNGTVNTLVDGANGDQKAALYCKGHLELKGKGTLNVTGNTGHAISAKEYIEMKNCTVNIPSSVKDGINCNQYFLMESGSLTIVSPGDDGIQVSYKDAADRESEDTGSFTILDGDITIEDVTATASKAIKAEGDVYVDGGSILAKTSAPGEWDSEKLKTKASACISADGNVVINDGTLNLIATGGGGKGVSCDGDFTYNGGVLTVVTQGGVLAYVNETLNQNYTGNTDRIDSDYKSSPKAVKVDGNVEINGGSMILTTSGNGGEGIESKAVLTINDGDVKVRAKDDCINSSSTMYIKGGKIDVVSTGNDGLDSNGDMFISGGVVMAFGAGGAECGIDVNSEEGYSLYFTGGYILGVGGRNSVPTKSESTQPYITVNASLEADMEVSVSEGDDTLYTFTLPSDFTNVSLGGGYGPGGMGGGSSTGILISVEGMKEGNTYTVDAGGTTTTATAQLTGSNGFGGGFRP